MEHCWAHAILHEMSEVGMEEDVAGRPLGGALLKVNPSNERATILRAPSAPNKNREQIW